MRILVTESLPQGAAVAREQLAAEGHEVVLCHPPEIGAAPCAGLAAGRGCPLADGDIDLLVDVRQAPGPMTAREAGLLCGLRGGVPTLVAGSPPSDAALPDTAACELDDVAEACAEVASPTGETVRRSVADALAPILRRDGIRPTVQPVELDGAIHLYVSVTHPLTPDQVVLLRRMAWLAYTRATRGRVRAVVHVAHHPGPPPSEALDAAGRIPAPRPWKGSLASR